MEKRDKKLTVMVWGEWSGPFYYKELDNTGNPAAAAAISAVKTRIKMMIFI